MSDLTLYLIAALCLITAASLIAYSLRASWLPSLMSSLKSIHRPRRYSPRHRAVVSRRVVFALPVRLVAAA